MKNKNSKKDKKMTQEKTIQKIQNDLQLTDDEMLPMLVRCYLAKQQPKLDNLKETFVIAIRNRLK